MTRRTYTPHSHVLGGPMPVAIHGRGGFPVLVFPTAGSDFEEFERQGMLQALSHHVESGWLRFYCIDSLNTETFLDEQASPGTLFARQELYHQYLEEELIPFIHADCGQTLPITAIGSSFGAYHAVSALLRHPSDIRRAIGMSGIYDVSSYAGVVRDEVYRRNNPVELVAEIERETLAECHITLVCGQGPWERTNWTVDFSRHLSRHGIEHKLDLWGPDVSHDWPWWKNQLNVHLPRVYGA